MYRRKGYRLIQGSEGWEGKRRMQRLVAGIEEYKGGGRRGSVVGCEKVIRSRVSGGEKWSGFDKVAKNSNFGA